MNLPYGNWAIADNCSKGLPYVCKMNPSPKGGSLADYRGAPLDCPASFQTFSGDSAHCYKAFPEKVDWFEASKKCQRVSFRKFILIFKTRDRRESEIPWDLYPGTRIPGLGTGIGTDSLGTPRDSELWDSSAWDKNPWDWQSRPMPIPI